MIVYYRIPKFAIADIVSSICNTDISYPYIYNTVIFYPNVCDTVISFLFSYNTDVFYPFIWNPNIYGSIALELQQLHFMY